MTPHRTAWLRMLSDAATAALLITCAGALLLRGVDRLPLWIANFSARAEWDAGIVTRLLAAALIGSAAALLLLRRRPVTVHWLGRIGCGGVGFVALAELSALLSNAAPRVGGLAPVLSNATLLAVAAALLIVREQLSERPEPQRRPLGAGAVVTRLIVALGLGLAIAGQSPMPASPNPSGLIAAELDTANWTGKTIPGSGLGALTPELTALTLEGRSIVVLYNERCGRCHQLFSETLSGRGLRVIAVRVPPATGAVLAETDQPEEIDCPDCPRLTLPEGPAWLITPPVVLVVEDGRITCVAERDYEACLGPG